MTKIFCTDFKLDAKILAIIYICYQYKFPLSFMLSFYELYGDNSIFALKALSCCKKVPITDTTLIKIIEDSRTLYNQILVETRKIEAAKSEGIEYCPHLVLDSLSKSYKEFVEDYLFNNITDLFTPVVKLRFNTQDLYSELMP